MTQSKLSAELPTLSHINAETGTAQMVDVSAKAETTRTARAQCFVRLNRATVQTIADKTVPKGDVLTVARVAGILAAKRTGELIPLCHPLPLTNVQIDLALQKNGVAISALASCIGRTGVEMEALTAATVAALTIYDMCKSADKHIVIERVFLQEKTGGKSGPFSWDGNATDENAEGQ